MTGQVNLNGAWINYEDWRANRIMKAKRSNWTLNFMTFLIVAGMIAFSIVFAVK